MILLAGDIGGTKTILAVYSNDNFPKKLVDFGFRAEIDIRNEKVGFKIREHTMQRIPFLSLIHI